MAVWTAIPDSDIDPDSPFTTGLATAYRENVIAAFERASGSPVPGADFITLQAQLSSSVAGRAQMKTATVSLSGSLPTSSHTGITLDAYAFFPMIHSGGTASPTAVTVSGHGTDGASADNPRFSFYNSDIDDTGTYDVDYRYITA